MNLAILLYYQNYSILPQFSKLLSQEVKQHFTIIQPPGLDREVINKALELLIPSLLTLIHTK